MPSFIRQTHVMAFCLALLLAVPTATPANASWWNPFSWWDAPPSAQELIQQRPNLARQPVDVRGFIENTVDEFRRNGGGEVDVEQMLDDMDEAYSQMGSLSNPLLIYVKGPLNPKRTALKALAAACIGDFEPATKVAACIAAGVLAVVVLKETADEARKRTEDWAKKKRDEQPKLCNDLTKKSWNYRTNLEARTGARNAAVWQAHHIFPQKAAFSGFWALYPDFNIHDPNCMTWWRQGSQFNGSHQKHSAAYNNEWTTFFAGNPTPTRAQIVAHGISAIRSYSIKVNSMGEGDNITDIPAGF